jgi:hypothetical protein
MVSVSLYYLIRPGQHRGWDREAERLGGERRGEQSQADQQGAGQARHKPPPDGPDATPGGPAGQRRAREPGGAGAGGEFYVGNFGNAAFQRR